MNTITLGEWVGCFFCYPHPPYQNSEGYSYWCRLFLWILDINLQNFVRGYFSKFSVRGLNSCVHASQIYFIVVFYKAHAILYSCILYCVLLQSHFYIVLAEVKKANQIQLTARDTWSLHASLISATRYPTYLIDSCTPDFSSTQAFYCKIREGKKQEQK